MTPFGSDSKGSLARTLAKLKATSSIVWMKGDTDIAARYY
jgi:hypothetical protein